MSKKDQSPPRPKYLSDGENRKEGGYSRTLFQTLHYAYKPFLVRIFMCLGLGILGRGLLLANTNVIGYWVDTLVGKPSPLTSLSPTQIIMLLLGMAVVGFFMSLIFRVAFSRLSAKAISSFYDEVTLRTSRLPMSFFDNTPAGRIITRFSSDYGNVFRLFGGPWPSS